MFPLTRPRVFGYWEHIPQTPCQSGEPLWTPSDGILR